MTERYKRFEENDLMYFQIHKGKATVLIRTVYVLVCILVAQSSMK